MTNARVKEAEATLVLDGFMRAMFTQLIATLARSLRLEDLRLSEIAALQLLERDKSLTIGDLARLLEVPMPAASRIATHLVDKGLVLRQENPQDRRVKVLTLSEQGLGLIARTSSERVHAAVSLVSSLPAPTTQTVLVALHQLIQEAAVSRPEQR
ncbi:MAG: MarR family transcriptional regulator [Devosia sp.]